MQLIPLPRRTSQSREPDGEICSMSVTPADHPLWGGVRAGVGGGASASVNHQTSVSGNDQATADPARNSLEVFDGSAGPSHHLMPWGAVDCQVAKLAACQLQP